MASFPVMRPFAACLLALLLPGVAGCEPEEVSKDVQARRDRGRDEAAFREFKLVSDCGAFADKEEQYGCAQYVRSLDD